MKIVSLSAITVALFVAGSASAQTAPAPTAPAPATPDAVPRFTASSTLGDLIANPEAKAVLEKHIPEVLTHPSLDQALGMTLSEVSPYIGGDTVVNTIATDLALIK